MTFLVSVKSTIDYIAAQIAAADSWDLGNLDSTDAYEAVLTSENPAVVWEIGSYTESPSVPLYEVEFFIGAKTVVDAGAYDSTNMLQNVLNYLPVGEVVQTKNYSGPTASAETGMLFITSVELEPQMFDKHAGIRMVRIEARAQSYL